MPEERQFLSEQYVELNSNLDFLFKKIEKRENKYILRRHENGLYCIGLRGDIEHFRSYSLKFALYQAYIWLKFNHRFFKGENIWKQGVDGDGNKVTN